MHALKFFALALLIPASAHASLSHEYLCEFPDSYNESSELRVSISPDGSKLIALGFEGEIEELYTREEVVQFKYTNELDRVTQLFLQVESAADRSGTARFRVDVKGRPGAASLVGRYDALEYRGLELVPVYTARLVCHWVE